MQQIIFFKATRSFVRFVEKAVIVDPQKPYTFRVSKSASRLKQSTASLQRILKWASANGSDVEILDSKSEYWLIKITDPVAGSLERHLKTVKGEI